MILITSTMSADVNYTAYEETPSGGKIPAKAILIRGGSNVVDKRTLVTPHGIVTEVTEEELKMLEENEVFRQHCANGFLVVTHSEKDAKRVAGDMAEKDASAPKVEADFVPPDEDATIKVGASEKKKK